MKYSILTARWDECEWMKQESMEGTMIGTRCDISISHRVNLSFLVGVGCFRKQ
jgi:hypothetical protein